MQKRDQEQNRTDEERTVDAFRVFQLLTEPKNYGRSKRRKGAE